MSNKYDHPKSKKGEEKGKGGEKTPEKKDWRDTSIAKIIVYTVTIVGCILLLTCQINYISYCRVEKTYLYWLVLAAIGIWGITRWYLKRTDIEIVIKLMKFSIAVNLFMLPFVVAIVGYGHEHCIAWIKGVFQQNEIVRVERDRRQGLEAVLLKDYKIEGKIMKKGEKLPLVTTNNSVQEEQRGPNKFIEIYTPSGNTAWINLGDVVPTGKTVHCDGYDKNYDLSGKLITVTFRSGELVKVVDNLSIGQKYIVTGAPAGKLKAPFVNDFSKFMDVPMGVVRENKTANSLYYKSEPGTKIAIKFL